MLNILAAANNSEARWFSFHSTPGPKSANLKSAAKVRSVKVHGCQPPSPDMLGSCAPLPSTPLPGTPLLGTREAVDPAAAPCVQYSQNKLC